MSTPAATDDEVSIVRTEGVLGGKPRLDGRRISVLDVTELLKAGYSIEEVATELEISDEEVRDAARYYRRHTDEIAELEARREAVHEELRTSGGGPSE